MRVVSDLLDRLLETMLFLVLVSMVAVVTVNVFCRFVLQFSLFWGDELAQILLVWLTFLGAAVATRDKGHYAFDYLVANLPGKGRRLVLTLSHVLVIAMTGALLYYSGRVTWEMRHWVMPATGISRAWVYGACPLGCALVLIYAVRNLGPDLRAVPPPAPEEAPP